MAALVGLVGGLVGIALENRRQAACADVSRLQGELALVMDTALERESEISAEIVNLRSKVAKLTALQQRNEHLAEKNGQLAEKATASANLASKLTGMLRSKEKAMDALASEKRAVDAEKEELMAARAALDAQLQEQRQRLLEWRSAIAHLLASARFQDEASAEDATVLRNLLTQIESETGPAEERLADRGEKFGSTLSLSLGGLVSTLSMPGQALLAGVLHSAATSANEASSPTSHSLPSPPAPRAKSPKRLNERPEGFDDTHVLNPPTKAAPSTNSRPALADRSNKTATTTTPTSGGKSKSKGGSWRFTWGSKKQQQQQQKQVLGSPVFAAKDDELVCALSSAR